MLQSMLFALLYLHISRQFCELEPCEKPRSKIRIYTIKSSKNKTTIILIQPQSKKYSIMSSISYRDISVRFKETCPFDVRYMIRIIYIEEESTIITRSCSIDAFMMAIGLINVLQVLFDAYHGTSLIGFKMERYLDIRATLIQDFQDFA